MFACLDAALELVQAAWRNDELVTTKITRPTAKSTGQFKVGQPTRNGTRDIWRDLARTRMEVSQCREDEVSRRSEDGIRRSAWMQFCLLTVFLRKMARSDVVSRGETEVKKGRKGGRNMTVVRARGGSGGAARIWNGKNSSTPEAAFLTNQKLRLQRPRTTTTIIILQMQIETEDYHVIVILLSSRLILLNDLGIILGTACRRGFTGSSYPGARAFRKK
jgi:hypothetical protein